jgi:hypothetical protein
MILPEILPALVECSQKHWSLNARSLALNVLTMFKQVDEALYAKLMSVEEKRRTESSSSRSSRWDFLEAKSA